jgi:HK97 family phage portal protein
MSIFSKRAVGVERVRVSNWVPGVNYSGETINESNALQVTPVLACVALLADSVAVLPARAIREIGDRTESVPMPSWLRDTPEQTTYELFHQMVSSLALHGNSFNYIDRDPNTGAVLALTPLHPTNVQVTAVNGKRYYTTNGVPVPESNMLHIRWWTPPQSLVGISPLEMQKTSIGLALAMERHLAQFYSQGATPSSVLEVDGDLTVEQAKVLQETWETQNRRRRRPAVLTNGIKWRSVQTSAADAEMNETRAEQIAQIARIFRVPTYMIGARGDSQTYQNNESAGMHFVTYTLLPWLRRIEVALSSLMPSPRRIVFDTSYFLRADTINRYRAYQTAIMSGILTPNEARQSENLEPYPGGDDFVMALPGAPMAGPGIEPPPIGVDADPPE